MSHRTSHEKFRYASRLGSEDAAVYLESLAAGIRERQIHMESGRHGVTLRVADEVNFECSVKEANGDGRAGFTLGVEWRGTTRQTAETAPRLQILTPRTLDQEAIEFALALAHPTDTTAGHAARTGPSVDATTPDEAAENPPSRPSVRKKASRKPKPAAVVKKASRRAPSAGRRPAARRAAR